MHCIWPKLCVIFLSFLGCLSQEATQSQSSTDAAAKTDWDTTSQPLTTSVVDTQVEKAIPPRNEVDKPRIVENSWERMLRPWRPMLMPIPPYRDRIYSRFEVKDSLDLYPFLFRPDGYYPTDWNNTAPSKSWGYPVQTGYQPLPPPGYFYPQPMPDRNPRNRYPDQTDSVSRSQISDSQDGSDTSKYPVSYSPPARYMPPFASPYANPGNVQIFQYPPVNYFWRNGADVRNQGSADSPTPYPYPPSFYPAGGPSPYPEVDIYVRPPYGDEDSGSVSPENIAERRQSLPSSGIPPEGASPINLPFGPPVPLQPIPPPNIPMDVFPYGYPPQGLQPQYPVPPAFIPRPMPILPSIPPQPNTNLLDGPLPPKPVDVPIPNLSPSPPGNIPDVVNVDVFDADTTKPDEGPSANIPYKFGYDMNDGLGTDQHREETSDAAGVVTGSYGYRDLHGVYRVVNYIADKDGFRALVKTNEPGAANPGSADVVVLAESPPLQTVAEGLRRSDIDVSVSDDQSEMEIEIESIEKK